MRKWTGPPRGSPLRGLHRPCLENEGLQRPASAAFRAPPVGNRVPGQVISRCPLGEGSDGCAKGQPDPEATPAPRHLLPRPPRCALGAVVLGPGATLRALWRRGGRAGGERDSPSRGAARGRGRPSRAWRGPGEPPFYEENRRPLPVSGSVGRCAAAEGRGGSHPFLFPLALSPPFTPFSPPSLPLRFASLPLLLLSLPSLPSPPPPALRSRRRDPGGPSRGLFPAAPASRRRVACHLSRTSNPSVRAAACRHPSPPPAAGSPTVTPRPGKPTPGRGDDCGLRRRPVLGPLSLLSPPSTGIVLPPLSRGPRCGVCTPLSSLFPPTPPPRWGDMSQVTLKPLLSRCRPRRCAADSVKAALAARPCPAAVPASGHAVCVCSRQARGRRLVSLSVCSLAAPAGDALTPDTALCAWMSGSTPNWAFLSTLPSQSCNLCGQREFRVHILC